MVTKKSRSRKNGPLSGVLPYVTVLARLGHVGLGRRFGAWDVFTNPCGCGLVWVDSCTFVYRTTSMVNRGMRFRWEKAQGLESVRL